MIFFLIFAQSPDCGYTLELPRRGGSNEYQQSMFWSKGGSNVYPQSMFLAKIRKIGIYSIPTVSRYLLYRGICISRERSSAVPPSNGLCSASFEANVKRLTPAKSDQDGKTSGKIMCTFTKIM